LDGECDEAPSGVLVDRETSALPDGALIAVRHCWEECEEEEEVEESLHDLI
jgi:hypothetical protein